MSVCNISGVGAPSANFADPCVSNAAIGSIYINTSNRDVYIRTKISIPALAGDFENICSVIDTCTQVSAAEVAFDDTTIPFSCDAIVSATTVADAIRDIVCFIRNPGLILMSYTYSGTCTLTTTAPTTLQTLFNGLLCRDEEILGKTFGWGIQGDASRTIGESASQSDVLMRTGDTVIGSLTTVVANSKLSVVGNIVSGTLSTSTISGSNNAIIGGSSQTIGTSTSGDAIIGGNQHQLGNASARSVIIGGEGTIVNGSNNGVFAGLSQLILAGATQAVVLGGTSNTAGGGNTAAIGGQSNNARGTNSVAIGGTGNISDGTDDVILGGEDNVIYAQGITSSVIASRSCTLEYVTVGPVRATIIASNVSHIYDSETVFTAGTTGSEVFSAVQSGIIGGDTNVLNESVNSAIIGGSINTIFSTSGAVILGGSSHIITASGQNSSVLYGDHVYISAASSLGGGSVVSVASAYSIGLGRNVTVGSAHAGSFIWQCSHTSAFVSAAANEFAIKPHGGVRIRTNTAGTVGVDLAAGGSSWVAVSSEKVKDNFIIANTKVLLEKLKNLDIFSFNYKKDLDSDEVYSDINLGTTAEQWDTAFGEFFTPKTVKNSDGAIAGISYMDAIGVLLGAVKQLTLEIEELKNDYTRISCQTA